MVFQQFHTAKVSMLLKSSAGSPFSAVALVRNLYFENILEILVDKVIRSLIEKFSEENPY